MLWLKISLITAAAACLLPVGVFCAQCLVALLPTLRRRRAPTFRHRPVVAVLVPAHNEETILEATLRSIQPQLCAGDQILVVADNCTDRTAAVARKLGVNVVERFDANYRGKGYALDCGITHLRRQGQAPDILIMIDADCTAMPGAIDALVQQVVATNRPAQACYLLERAPNGGVRDMVSALAFLVKNRVRPTGLRRMGLPCLFTGVGMALPWDVISQASLASGNIVEDMQLGLDLALHGRAPLFCGDAHLVGRLPTGIKIAYGQRTRWEHGHLQTLFSRVPKLLKAGMRYRAGQAFALGLELSVPPLALLMTMLLLATGIACAFAPWTGWLPAEMLAAGITSTGICLLGAWAKFGRQTIPIAGLLGAPLYMAWKLPMYLAFVFRRHTEWNRTERAEFEMAPVGATDFFERDYNRDVLPETRAPAPRGQLKLGELVRPTYTPAGCVEHVIEKLKHKAGGVAVLPSIEHLQWCAADADFARILAGFELVTGEATDSSLGLGSATQKDFVTTLTKAAADHGLSLFLLGDHAEITAEAAAAISLGEPKLRLAGIYSAPDGFDSDHEALRHVTRMIVRAKPDLVLVALGTPKQERLVDKLRHRLPATWWLVVGNSFDFARRDTRRARLRDIQPPLDELGRILARGFGDVSVADRPPSPAPPPPPAPTLVYQSFLHGLHSAPIEIAGSVPPSLSKVRAVVLLGGSIRPSPLAIAAQRSILDLPLEDGRSILWHWRDHAIELCERLGSSTLPIRVLIDANSPQPMVPDRGHQAPVTLLQDASNYRGTAGVLADLLASESFEDEDYLLIATAAQVLLPPLWQTASLLATLDADVATVAHTDGTPAGIMLARCGALRSIPKIGYVDLKEQTLPGLARGGRVRHLNCPAPTALPIRTAAEYVAAIQHRHRHTLARPVPADAFAEDCRPSFAVVEESALVDSTAQLHDSIILRGARIAAGAKVIRSVVGPKAQIRRNQTVIDEFVPNAAAPAELS